MRLAAAALLLAACQAPQPPSRVSAPAAERWLPFCAYDLSSPVQARAELDGYFAPDGTDCVPVEYGDLYQFGLGLPGGDLFKLTVPRSGMELGLPVAPAPPTAAFYGEFGNRVCTDWTGEVLVQGDLPHWSVYVDVTCPELGVRVQGQAWGWPAGTPAP